MDIVSCSCAKCDTFISDFDNAWNKFGKGHYMPIQSSTSMSTTSKNSWTTGLAPSQDARMAALNTVLEDSYLQDLACKGCGEVLGLKCQNAPVGHILKKDQILLRLKKLNVLSRRTGKVAQPVVRKSHELNKDAGTPTGERKDGLDAENEETDQFRRWTEVAIEEQKADIERISASVQRIETDMQSFKDFMTVVRKELSIRPTNIELDSIRASITETIDRRQGVALSSEDLELMTDSISKISSRVSEVDTLKLEVQLLKSRIKRFEENESRAAEITRSEPRPLSVRPLVEQLQRAAASADNSPTQHDLHAAKRRRISGQDISESPSLNARSASCVAKPSRLSNVQVADRTEDDLSGITYAESDDDYTEKPRRGEGRSRSASNQKPLADGERPKRRYVRRARSPMERGFDENGFPLTANGERDKRYKSGKFAGRRPTRHSEGGVRERRPYGSGVVERREREREREARSGARGHMTRSEEREEMEDREEREESRERRREEGDNTDDYEEEAEQMNEEKEERGRKERSSSGQENEKDEEGKSEYPDPEEDEQKRKEALEKRERLVRETMEREMSMNF